MTLATARDACLAEETMYVDGDLRNIPQGVPTPAHRRRTRSLKSAKTRARDTASRVNVTKFFV